jgi:hypothetical protein
LVAAQHDGPVLTALGWNAVLLSGIHRSRWRPRSFLCCVPLALFPTLQP